MIEQPYTTGEKLREGEGCTLTCTTCGHSRHFTYQQILALDGESELSCGGCGTAWPIKVSISQEEVEA